MLNVLDLFSGIGGFSLGLERTGGFRTVAFCEIDPYCQAVLRKHWPNVPIHEDIRTLTAADVPGVDVICGGFPCQPFSSASRGRRKGKLDDRHLWPEMLRLVKECRPRWVLGENVTQLDRLALEEVVADLESIGYQVLPPLEIPACAVGCDHWRARIWILGYSDRDGEPNSPIYAKASWMPRDRPDAGSSRGEDGLPARLDRVGTIGNAIVPQIPEIIGRAILKVEELEPQGETK